MNVIEAIRSKRAVRTYRDDPVPDDVVRTILHAGRRAQSAKNDQPWHFLVIQERATLKGAGGNQPEPRLHRGCDALRGSGHPHRLRRSRRSSSTRARPPPACNSPHGSSAWSPASAPSMRLEKARALLGFPRDRHLHLMVAFGYPLPEDAQARPGRKTGRLRLEEVVRWERW